MESNHNYNGALQQPIGSGFNATSTNTDVIAGVNLKGKTAIITGGYAGIGLETTKTFVQAGAKVIVPARDIEKAKRNLNGLANVEVEGMDLMDFHSINAFAEKFLSSGQPLDFLINNAGIMWVPLRRDARGYESQLATNHLGHFQLTAKLWPALKKADRARVVNVSSYGHQIAPFDFEDPNFEHRPYETLLGYGQSKTANNSIRINDVDVHQHFWKTKSFNFIRFLVLAHGKETAIAQNCAYRIFSILNVTGYIVSVVFNIFGVICRRWRQYIFANLLSIDKKLV